MALSWGLIGFPLFVLVISIMMQTGGSIYGASASPGISCGPASGCIASAPSTFTCPPTIVFGIPVPLPCNITSAYHAVGGNAAIACTQLNTLPSSPQTAALWGPAPIHPAYCLLDQVFLNSGDKVTASSSANGASFFSFIIDALGPAGFVAVMLSVAGIAVLAGIQILGSGVNSFSVKILFFVGLMLGTWAMLSATEATISPGASFFVQLNGQFANLGTSFYVVLTLFYVAGTAGLIAAENE